MIIPLPKYPMISSKDNRGIYTIVPRDDNTFGVFAIFDKVGKPQELSKRFSSEDEAKAFMAENEKFLSFKDGAYFNQIMHAYKNLTAPPSDMTSH